VPSLCDACDLTALVASDRAVAQDPAQRTDLSPLTIDITRMRPWNPSLLYRSSHRHWFGPLLRVAPAVLPVQAVLRCPSLPLTWMRRMHGHPVQCTPALASHRVSLNRPRDALKPTQLRFIHRAVKSANPSMRPGWAAFAWMLRCSTPTVLCDERFHPAWHTPAQSCQVSYFTAAKPSREQIA
jgi:hypothetical protein